jgi:hypothetical protein
MLKPELITEETIATLFDHFQGAAKTARKLLNSKTVLTDAQRTELEGVCDGWYYCEKVLLGGKKPHRER